MIKFSGGTPDDPLIGFGLSFESLDRLRAGEPIKVELGELGLAGTLLIFAGITEQELLHQLQEFISDDTKVHISDRFKQ